MIVLDTALRVMFYVIIPYITIKNRKQIIAEIKWLWSELE